MTTVILISGKQGSGKTTLANSLAKVIRDSTSCRVEETKFAGLLYELHNKIYRYVRRYNLKLRSQKDGRLLQLIGDWAREVHGKEVLVEATKAKVREFEIDNNFENPGKDLFVIIDDCRCVAEFEAFPKAFRIRLECSEQVRRNRCSSWRATSQHSTETDLDKSSESGLFDLVLDTEKLSKEDCVKAVLQKFGGNVGRRQQARSSR